jgi:hypothetical protein
MPIPVTCLACNRESIIPDRALPQNFTCFYCGRGPVVTNDRRPDNSGQLSGTAAVLGAAVAVGGLAYFLGQAADKNGQRGGKVSRQVFYSFHYEGDAWRVSQVRNMGVVDENSAVSDNDWETVKRGGDAGIQRWIDSQMQGRQCVVVLIGAGTAARKWINYEIKKAWQDGKGLLGIHIHRLKDRLGNPSYKGANPFAEFTVSGVSMANYVDVYAPPYTDSKDVYGYINQNMSGWVERAILRRR